MVSLKQELQVLDYFGAFCVFISFFVIILIISVTCILWFCVSPTDDVTVFAKWNLLRRKRSYDVKVEQRPLNQ
ncbi:Neuropeptide-like peptide [Trichinella spiralis]